MAGWFSDYLVGRGDSVMQSLGLVGGIKGWATDGREFVDGTDEYDASAWAANG